MIDEHTLITDFYTSFQKLDANGMVQCYHRDIEFSDPVFPLLRGEEVAQMWKMLCMRAQDFKLSFKVERADNGTGNATWEARYTFSQTGRTVLNRVASVFTFRDGKIIGHHDTFDFWKWSGMALGPAGLTLGWSPWLKNKVRRQAAANLQRHIQITTRAKEPR